MSFLDRGVLRSLRTYNYRLWAAGALVSNVGTWVQRTAQDWLVLTELTRHSASAVGVVMALQFGPQLLLLPFTGYAADHLNQRRMLIATQAAQGLLSLILGVLTLTGVVQLWHVYVLAFLFGCVTAFDYTVRQTFVGELVGDADLPNAVSLNSTSFNMARMVGPAVAGTVIASVGTGWAFIIDAVSFIAVLIALLYLRTAELRANPRATRVAGGLTAGFRYVWERRDLRAIVIMLLLIGTFGLNFPIFTATMAVRIFGVDAQGYGFLSSVMAVGTVGGSLFTAGLERPQYGLLLTGSAVFGLGCMLAALAPSYWLFALALVVIGAAAMLFITSTNTLMQLSTEPHMRGRVMAIRLAVALGGTPVGAPIVGWVADHWGPRWALALGGASGIAAALVAMQAISRNVHRRAPGAGP